LRLPELKIGHLVAKLPIIQGGMAVRISTAPLAAAVANEGGIGIIAATGMGLEELRREIRAAREKTKGIIGVNVLFAAKQFAELVKTAILEGIDLVISGAGVSRDMYDWGKMSGTAIVPIVSSGRLARLAEKLGAAAIVVEGTEAGGHLGTDRSWREILPEVKENVCIPVIAAGGIIDGKDIAEALSYGADGVQMGTRFAASVESGAAPALKKMYLNATEKDVVVIESPVGLPGRALYNSFLAKIDRDEISGTSVKCGSCLKHCSQKFCILKALNEAQKGNLDEGLVFSGQQIAKIKEILSVKEIFRNLLKEVEAL